MIPRMIVATPTHSSLPDRQHDWCAHYEGEEEAGNYGYGATKAEAVLDFIENCQADHDERLGKVFPAPTQPMVFLLTTDEGVLFDPQGKFHGWQMRRHPDGLWISVRKLEAEDPEASLPDFLRATHNAGEE